MGQMPVPYHVSRDLCVWWGSVSAFNAPARVRASGGGRRPCARRLPVRVSLFPYSTAASARPLIDSLDAISVFEVVHVEGCVYAWPELRVEGLILRTDSLVTRIGEGTPY